MSTVSPDVVAYEAAMRVRYRAIAQSKPLIDAESFARMTLSLDPDLWQLQVLRSTAQRLLLNCSRQSGKSTTAAILALYTALFKHESLVLMVSPSHRQSTELYRKVQDFMDAMPRRPRFNEDTKTSMTLTNGSRIISLPSSEATIRGYSAVDLLIEDEAARVPDALYTATRPMLAVSNGRHVLMSTPWGQRGHFWQAWEHGEGWEKIKITAQECPRISEAFLDEERQALGPLWFQSEYECKFVDTEDQVFRTIDIDRALRSDITPLFTIGDE